MNSCTVSEHITQDSRLIPALMFGSRRNSGCRLSAMTASAFISLGGGLPTTYMSPTVTFSSMAFLPLADQFHDVDCVMPGVELFQPDVAGRELVRLGRHREAKQ